MKQTVINIILDKYEKAIEHAAYYRERVTRHENQLRDVNKEIQKLKTEIIFYKAKIDELEKKEL
jgi:phage shock protein A